MVKPIRVSKPFVVPGDVWTMINCQVDGGDLPLGLWFCVSSEYADYLETKQPDWIATSLLIPAMLRGADLEIDAPVSINADLQTIFAAQNARLQPVKISARATAQRKQTGGLLGTGFSAGVDSFFTLSEFPIELLVTNNVGAMGDEADGIFKVFCKRTGDYAKAKGIRSIAIGSNLAAFYENISFQETHTIRNVSAILAVRRLFGKYCYSSAFGPSSLHDGLTDDMATADPKILKLLSVEGLEFVSSGQQFTRWEKTERVAKLADAKQLLDVCASLDKRATGYVNCGKCFKCARQLRSFEILGCLKDFEHLFDMKAYRAEYPHLMANILNSSSSIEREIASKQRMPAAYRILAIAKKRTPTWFSWRLGQLMRP